MKKVVIIGGGFAGLTSAVYLAEKGYQITLLESSPKLGGKAYSFLHEGKVVDNGQHILMGCYKYTLDFLEKISAKDKFDFQNKMEVEFVNSDAKNIKLSARTKLYPFNLMLAVFCYSSLSVIQRVKASILFFNLFFYSKEKLENITAYDWLIFHKQDKELIEKLWEPIIVSIFNTNSKVVSALLFVRVLKEIFLRGNKASTFVIPQNGLSDNYCRQAEQFIKKNNGIIKVSNRVIKLEEKNDKISSIVTKNESISDFDYLISTVSSKVLQEILPENIKIKMELPDLVYSPIITIHIWCSSELIKQKFVGLQESKIHWIFKHENHYSLLTSAADDLIKLNDEEIISVINNELSKYFTNYSKDDLQDFLIIKEKRATFLSDIKTELAREDIVPNYSNLFLAGDWVNTGLPSTIESAVKSGIKAVEEISRE